MIGSDDCIELAQRYAQLAVACSVPSLSEALMKLAGDYLAQSHKQSAGRLSFTNSPIRSASETSRGNAAALGALWYVPSR
jgi:hypothetical protein